MQHKTDVKVKLSASEIQASSQDPIQIPSGSRKSSFLAFLSALICWVWIRLVSVSTKSKNCCLYWLQLEYLLIFCF